MTNKEKYKQAFSVLHTSANFSLEVEKMNLLKQKRKMKSAAVAAAACLLLVGGSATAYAADIGGIQRTMQLWIHGDQTEATIEIHPDGSYNMSYEDENGNAVESGGGGVAIEEDGTERPLTEAELMAHIYAPSVEYEDDGTVWVYYYDQKINITDKFEDGICYVKVSNGDETLYMTIEYDNGWSTNPYKYNTP